ncbi:hypothetical protein M8J77_019308 [Diaphorina citri]|nr:hypothetical protein M8J77_019308 [Diaphorina citri]
MNKIIAGSIVCFKVVKALLEKTIADTVYLPDRKFYREKTHMGRARAWLRLALMQKKLADYLQVLVDHRDDILVEYFETDALLMSDEAIVILGKLLSLNVIDCNLCVKEEDLDCQQGVIDFSLYLRSACYHDHPEEVTSQVEDNMSLVLDQKNYIEELNRHLNATVGNLQTQVESLTTTNALMREDLSIAEKNLRILIQENENLKNQLANSSQHTSNLSVHEDKTDANSTDADLKKAFDEEKKQRQDLERELHLQVGLKAEMEVAMKLLERDVHQKQDTIIELRRQLEDIKMINLEMYKKLQDSESSLKHKTELVSKLEAKVQSISESLHTLEQNYQTCQNEKAHILETLKKGHSQLSEESNKNNQLELEMKSEMSKRLSIEENYHKDRDKLKQLTAEIAQLKAVNNSYLTLQEEHHKLQDKYKESELALEELGAQLSKSKLQVSDLMEEHQIAKRATEAQWAKDKEAITCRACDKEFTVTRRRHHCRNCGEIFCNMCSDNKMALPSAAKPVRVCDECNVKLVEKLTVVNS